MNYMNSDI